MTLVGTHWSKRGVYRSGGAIGFVGHASYGRVPHIEPFGSIQQELTLGMTVHLPAGNSSGTGDDDAAACLAHKPGAYKLMIGGDRRLVWAVRTAGGWLNTTAHTPLHSQGPNIVKATFNRTTVCVFLDGREVGRSSCASCSTVATSTADMLFGAAAVAQPAQAFQKTATPLLRAAGTAPEPLREPFAGALEEIYLKNVSTEDRKAYLYTDSVRLAPSAQGGVAGAYVFDLTRPAARKWYAEAMARLLNTADFDVTQWDGFEINFLVAGWDLAHSPKTFNSGVYRSDPAPDWYHLGFPTAWGLGVLQTMEATHALLNSNTAVECSFMAPGLGPFRPDMAPFVDQDLYQSRGAVGLGLEWHPKMLLRTASSGTVINPYVTIWWPMATKYEVDYWFGGLVAGGVTPQLGWVWNGTWTANTTAVANVRRWLDLYRYYGHLTEGGVHPLYYDERCCHIEGACEWVACQDIVLSLLQGGEIQRTNPTGSGGRPQSTRSKGKPVAGLYGGSSRHVTIAPSLAPNGTTLVVFAAANVTQLRFDVGVAGDTHLDLALTSNAAVQMGGGWWHFDGGSIVLQTVLAADGTVVVPAHQVVSAGTTGQVVHRVSAKMGQTVELRKKAVHRPKTPQD